MKNVNSDTYKPEPKPTTEPKPGYKWTQVVITGKWIEIPEDTAFCCDPGTETYWSM